MGRAHFLRDRTADTHSLSKDLSLRLYSLWGRTGGCRIRELLLTRLLTQGIVRPPYRPLRRELVLKGEIGISKRALS